jgi:hypothetical protein
MQKDLKVRFGVRICLVNEVRLAAQFALIVANRSGNQCNQRLLRFRNIYCETSERS